MLQQQVTSTKPSGSSQQRKPLFGIHGEIYPLIPDKVDAFLIPVELHPALLGRPAPNIHEGVSDNPVELFISD